MLTWLSINILYIVFVLCGLLIIVCFVLTGWLINSARVSKRNKARKLQQPLSTEVKIEELEKISKQFSKLMDKQIDELRSKTKKL